MHRALDVAALVTGLATLPALAPALVLHSAAPDRATYLQRPDLGRQLDAPSREAVIAAAQPCDLAFVIADGLSALAIEQNVVPFLDVLLARLCQDDWSIAAPAIVRQGRVAVGDEVAQLLQARAVVVLIGERPGLSSPDSMGLYMTWGPQVGLTDASRNCISNVRPAGMAYADAAHTLHYLLSEARRRGLSGVALKDDTEAAPSLAGQARKTFLL